MSDLEREKLLNTLIFFSDDNVLYPRKTKLIKLLYFLDFLHFESTGRSVTGLDYFAWEFGPVPRSFWREWENPKSDFQAHFTKLTDRFPDGTGQRLRPKKAFSENAFTRSELSLLKKLAKKHFKQNAKDMIESTHFQTGPWEYVYETQGDINGPIPYDLVFLRKGSEHDQEMLDIAHEKRILKKRYI